MATQIVGLSCPSCGGKLELTPDIERFACLYCGKEHLVQRGGGIVSLRPVVEKIEQVQKAVEQGTRFNERTADELLLQRVEKERKAAEGAFPDEWRKLDKVKASAGNNQFFAFIASVVGIGIGGMSALTALAALARMFQGQTAVGEAFGMAFSSGVVAFFALLVGLALGWAFLSASRRQSKQVQNEQQMLRSRLEHLQKQEAEVRARLKA